METACPQAVEISARLPHQIKDGTAVWPSLAFVDQDSDQSNPVAKYVAQYPMRPRARES